MSWTIRLAASADDDFQGILRWTVQQFGKRQAKIYATTLSSALSALREGPRVPGVRIRDEIGTGVCTLHVARNGAKGRHFIVFRVAADRPETIDVLRILHDAMDLRRHVAKNT